RDYLIGDCVEIFSHVLRLSSRNQRRKRSPRPPLEPVCVVLDARICGAEVSWRSRALARGSRVSCHCTSRSASGASRSLDVRFRGQTGKLCSFYALEGSNPGVIRRLHSTCLSTLVADRATEAWYHPSIA